MSGYDVEHNVQPTSQQTNQDQHRRPDLSSFFTAIDQVDTTRASAPQSPNARSPLPLPGDMAAAYHIYADALGMMRQDEDNELLGRMQEVIRNMVAEPPNEFKGVPDEFIAQLDRIDKKKLKDTDSCPICRNTFLDDKYPLVVELPCHKDHRFDLECITPWLKAQATCPLDRKVIWKKKEPPPPGGDDEDGEYDDMYA